MVVLGNANFMKTSESEHNLDDKPSLSSFNIIRVDEENHYDGSFYCFFLISIFRGLDTTICFS